MLKCALALIIQLALLFACFKEVAVAGSFYCCDLYFVSQNLILFIVMSFVNEGRTKDENFLKACITDAAVLSRHVWR